jgi:integrase/recombinase XerD
MANEPTSLINAQQRFLDYLKGQKRSISTILAYGKDVEQLITYLNSLKITQPETVTSLYLEDFKSDLALKNYTAKSISRKLNSIKTFFRFLKDQGTISDNVAQSVTHPKYETKPARILSKMEYRALRDACRGDNRMAAIVELMLQTGIRIGEVSRLMLEDIKDSEVYIRAYESQPTRSIPLNKIAKQAINNYMENREGAKSKALFITKTNRPLLIRNIRTSLDRYFRLAGLSNVKVNDLRNTWLAYQLSAGTSVVLLSKLAGHKRLSTTEKYIQKSATPENTGKAKLEEL